MSTNAGAIESSSDAVISSEPPSNSDIAVSKGVTVEVGAESIDSKTKTLATEPASFGVIVQELVDDATVSGGEIGIIMDNNEKPLNESSSDAVVSSEPPSNSDIAVSNGVTIVVGAESLDSKTETISTEPAGGVIVKDLVDAARVSGGEIGTVMDDDKKLLDESSSDAVVSAVPPAEPSDQDGGGDIVVEDSIDEVRVSRDVTGIVIENSDLVLDKPISDDVVSSLPLNNRDTDTVNGVNIGADSLGSKTEILTTEPSADQNGDSDIAIQDSFDGSKLSGDEKGIVTENIEKVSDENEVHNEEKDSEYKVTDIVWAKVKNYPWWPGQIFDPSSSTEVAKKHSNKKAFLVGYFGDQTFAWNKASNIKPFRKNFSKLEKQSNSKAFFHAVNCALDEVSRRVDFGLACSCLSEEVRNKIKSQVFVNAGIRKEASKIDGGDRFSTVSTFKPMKVVRSVQDLAREHFDGFSRLEVMSVRTQVLAFFRWKGYYQFQAQNILDQLDNTLEHESELPSTEEIKAVEDEKVSSKNRMLDVSDSDDSVPLKKVKSLTNVTPKGKSSVKGSKKNISKKATVEDEKPSSVDKKVSSKKRKPDVSDNDDSVPLKKVKSLTNVTPKGKSSVKGSKKTISKKATVEDEKPSSVDKKVSSKKRKPDVSDSDDSVPRKKVRSLTNVTPKGDSSVKRSKKNIGKKVTVEENDDSDENQASVGKKVSSKMRKPDVSDSDDSVPPKKERSLTNVTSKRGAKRIKKSKKATVEDIIAKEENGNGTGDKTSSISSPKKLFRVGDSICRIAKQISQSPSIVKKELQNSKNEQP